MSLRSNVRAFPVLLRVGFAEAVAYRAELFVWILTTTMPLIMMALWTAVAEEAPVGRFGTNDFVVYFLVTFVVRQLTASWSSFQINWEVRHGILSMRLLKPVHPVVAYGIEALAAQPLRLVIALPVAVLAFCIVGLDHLPADPWMWPLWIVSLAGSWLLVFVLNVAIGALAFFMESSNKVMDIWFALFFVLSGYLIPIELFPPSARAVVDLLPFRYQIGLPVEILTGAYDRSGALWMIARQWGFVALFGALTAWIWRQGIRRFEAYGG